MLAVEQIMDRLAVANVGTPGTTLFAHKMPATVTKGVLVLAPLTGSEIDYELPGWRRSRYQIIARAPSVSEAMTLAMAASAALTWLLPRTVPASGMYPSIEVKYFRPLHDPIVYPRSEGNLVEASVNFETAYVNR